MSKSLTFIINPAARFGKTKGRMRQLVREIKKQAPDAKIEITRHSLHATNLAKTALLRGCDRIVAIGGDGTINEVVNGFFDDLGILYSANASLAVIPSGTGADFVRNFEQPDDLAEQVEQAIHGAAQPTDVGLVRARSAHGEEISRYFMNVSSFGLSGLTLGFMDGVTKSLGPQAAYFIASAKAIRAFEPPTLIITDENGQEKVVEKCSLVSFANGKYFGGGMKVAPHAELDDGLLDVVMISDLSLMFFLLNGYRVYQGSHLHLSNVQSMRARECSIRAEGGTAVFIETDGELFAQLPAKYSIKPGAIKVVR